MAATSTYTGALWTETDKGEQQRTSEEMIGSTLRLTIIQEEILRRDKDRWELKVDKT